MPTVDSLDIQIAAQAKRANLALDGLISRLDRLSSSLTGISGSGIVGLADGVSRLATSMQAMNSVKATDFNRLAKNIQKLSTLDSATINNTANAISTLSQSFGGLGSVSQNAVQVGELASNLSKLGYKSIGTATQQMPALATALKNLMATLSTAPKVSRNLIDMTNALANLARQGRSVGSAASGLSSYLNRFSASATQASVSSRSLAAALGKLYANFWLLIRAGRLLWKSIESTADYIEAFNYFNVAFGKIGDEWSYQWEQYGYDNAEAYANSFADRMSETLGKMSGLKLEVGADGTGMLTSSGMKNLGLNIQEMTQAASNIAAITNSVGQTGEVSLAASQSLTALAGDMSSLFNMDYSDVMSNLQSGLIGMSRSLYKYGIDITNATLQTYAYELGLSKAVSEMTQAEKMQLRIIAILDQSKVAWSDLARTINSPSNMIRQFKNNIAELGMTIGQLFMPILTKVIPIINGLTIALTRLMVTIAGFFGIQLSLDGMATGFEGLEEDIGGVSSGLDDVAGSAKKAKAGLRGFDELKTISLPSSGGGGGGVGGGGGGIDLTGDILNASAEYMKAWEDAYAQMENKAEQFADKIYFALRPVKNLFEDISLGDWFAVGEDVSGIVSGIFDSFTKAIKKVNWQKIGNNIGKFFAGINWKKVLKSVGKFFWEGVNAAIQLFDGMFEEAPLETILLSLALIPNLFKKILASSIVKGFANLATTIGYFAMAVSGSTTAMTTLQTVMPRLAGVAGGLHRVFNAFFQSVTHGSGIFGGFTASFTALDRMMSPLSKGITGVVAAFAGFAVVKDSISDIVLGSGSLIANIGELALAVTAMGAAFSLVFGFPAGLIATGVVAAVGALAGVTSAVKEIEAEKLGQNIRDALATPGGVPIEEISGRVVTAIESIGNQFETVSQKSQELETAEKNIEDVWLEIETVRTEMEAGVLSVEEGTKKLSDLFSELAQAADTHFGALNSLLVSSFGENGAFSKYAEAVGVDVSDALFTTIGLTGDLKERSKELIALMSDPNISTEDYVTYQSELSEILGVTDDITVAVGNFDSAIKNIDLLDTVENFDKFAASMDDIKSAVEKADQELTIAQETITSYLEELMAQAKTAEEQQALQALIDIVPNAIENAKLQTRAKATEMTDVLQQELLDRIPALVEERSAEWDKLDPLEKLASGFKSKPQYVRAAIANFQSTYIDPVSKEVEEQFEDLGVEGAGWGKDALVLLTQAMFDEKAIYSEITGLKTGVETTYREGWEGILEAGLSGMDELAAERAKAVNEGFNKGILENAPSTGTTILDWLKKFVDEAADDYLDINSPSGLTMDKAANTVAGFNEGISENASSTSGFITEWLDGVLSAFDNLATDSETSWTNIGSKIIGAMETVKTDVSSIFGNIKSTIENSSIKLPEFKIPDIKLPHFKIKGKFSINPPSMPTVSVDWYEKGGFLPSSYTMIGAGENGVPEILGSVGGRPAIAGGEEITGIRDEIRATANEEMVLLRQQNQLLQAILQKEFGITTDDIGRSARAYAEDYFLRTGNEAYSF